MKKRNINEIESKGKFDFKNESFSKKREIERKKEIYSPNNMKVKSTTDTNTNTNTIDEYLKETYKNVKNPNGLFGLFKINIDDFQLESETEKETEKEKDKMQIEKVKTTSTNNENSKKNKMKMKMKMEKKMEMEIDKMKK
jgi:hypothetical protein